MFRMGGLPVVLLFALTVRPEGAVVRSGCSAEDSEVGRLAAGTEVTVRFSLTGDTGACYKISAGAVEGYLPASALANTAEFDKARRTAQALDLPDMLTAWVKRTPPEVGAGNAMELIQKNQPGLALEAIEKQLKTRPKDAGLLALAGYAAYRADEARRAVDYWKESLDVHADPEIEKLYQKAQRELEADRSGRKVYGSRFLVRYDDAEVPVDTARLMVEALEQEYMRIAGELGCSAQERISVIVQSREAYLKTTEAAMWSGGQFDGRIHVSLAEKEGIGPQTRRTFAHELVHACVADFGPVPAWLNEGLAQRLSGEQGNRSLVTTLVRAGKVPALDDLGRSWSQADVKQAAIAYATSLVAVDLVYSDFGYYGIRNVLRNPDILKKLTVELDKRLAE